MNAPAPSPRNHASEFVSSTSRVYVHATLTKTRSARPVSTMLHASSNPIAALEHAVSTLIAGQPSPSSRASHDASPTAMLSGRIELTIAKSMS